jgi:hypothetical protein
MRATNRSGRSENVRLTDGMREYVVVVEGGQTRLSPDGAGRVRSRGALCQCRNSD